MKPAPFEYYAPTTTREALAHLAQHGYDAKPLAGGQSLIPLMNFRLAQPAVLVDLNNINELRFIRSGANGELHLGAMTRQRTVEFDPIVAERAPMIHEAMPKIAYPQVRNRGTFGGSLAHADPSAELPTVAVALDARLRVSRGTTERWLPASEFFAGFFTTVMEPDELLTEIVVPPLPAHSGWSFLEVARRHHDFALVGVAAVVTLDGADRCRDARLVFFSVGDGPVQAHQAAALLRGRQLTAEAIQEAAELAARADVDPGSDINASADYRRHLVGVLGRRALTQAVARATGSGA
jgi:CO/xanthine dehydrogenase FAD-binding subunit